jgi:hypothetical protein
MGDGGVGTTIPSTGAADPVPVIRAHLDAYVDYVSRLERYIEDLRDLLAAHGSSDEVEAGPAAAGEGEGGGDDERTSTTTVPLQLIVGATRPAGGASTR